MAIAFVQEVGTGANAAATNTVVITLGSVTTTVGNHLIATTGSGGSGLTGVTDSKGNTWQVDVNASAADPHAGVASAKITAALVAGDTITLTFAGNTGAAAVVSEYSGLDPTSWFDTQANATGAAATASDSTATGTTAQADELLIGAMGSSSVTAYTPEVLSPVWNLTSTASSTGTVRMTNGMWRIVSATGTYSAKATWTSSKAWTQIIATYKAAAAAAGYYDPAIVPNPFVGPMVLRQRLLQIRRWFWPSEPPNVQVAVQGATVGVNANAPTPSVAPGPTGASVTVNANPPTVLSGTIVNVPSAATVAVNANPPAPTVAPSSQGASITVTGSGPSTKVSPSLGSPAAVTVTAGAPSILTGTPINLYVGHVDSAFDYLDYLRVGTMRIKTTSDRRNNTMDFTLAATPAQLAPDAGRAARVEHRIQFQYGTDVLFAGVIRSTTPSQPGGLDGHMHLAVSCQDWTTRASDTIIDPTVTSTVRTTVESDAARIDWLVSTFYDSADVDLDSTTYVTTLQSSMPAQDFTAMTLAQALDEICKLTGGTWFIDYGNLISAGSGIPAAPYLHYVAANVPSRTLTTPFGVAATDTLTSTAHGMSAGQAILFDSLIGGTGLSTNVTYYVIASGLTANAFKVSTTPGGSAVNFTTDVASGSFLLITPAPFGVSDNPDNVNTYGYADLTMPDESTEVRTSVVILGGDGYQERFTASGIPSDWATLGRTGVIKDDQVTDSATGALRAAAYFAANQDDQITGSFTCYRSGLVPGQYIQITSADLLAGWLGRPSPSTFRITEIETFYPKKGVVSYKVSFGQVPRQLHTAIADIAGGSDAVRQAATDVVSGVLRGYIGEIVGWTLSSPPVGFVMCDGASYPRTGAMAGLFAVIGTTFGSVDASHFNVPDLRGRFPLGVDGSHALASTGGSINHTHTGPSHTHTQPTHTHTGPSHTHTGPSHSHSHSHVVNSHTHTGPSHTHTGPSHAHDTPLTNTGTASDIAWANSPFGTGASITRTGTISGSSVGTSAAAMRTDTDGTQATGSGGTGATGSASPGTDTDATAGGTGATGSSGTGATGADGNDDTGASGTGATGTNNPPYISIYFVIRYA